MLPLFCAYAKGVESFSYAVRGQHIENRYRISLAIVNPQGQLVAFSGNAQLWAHMRSSAKPFQAQALFVSGAIQRYGWGLPELALAIASHDGGPQHLELAARMLHSLGLGIEHLACGAHMPADRTSRKQLEEAQLKPTALYNNCSGKHSGMLAVALALGASTHGYELAEHPVQQLNFQTVRDLCGLSEIPFAIDGCSVPTFVLPLNSAAQMFAYLAAPECAPPKYQEGLQQAFDAMRAHPELVAGPGSIDTMLMQQIAGLVAKRGAEGYYGMALQQSPWGPVGIALKVEDGSNAAREVAVVRLLDQLGLADGALELPWRRPVIKNVRGLEVGHYLAEINLQK